MSTGGRDDERLDESTRYLSAWAAGEPAVGTSEDGARAADPASAGAEVEREPASDVVEAVMERLADLRGPSSRYEDLGMLGRGGMGEVRRVHDRLLGRTAAMKILRADRLRDAASLARFLEEAQATAGLQHPGIVPVQDLGRMPDGRVFFVMREVQGQTLKAAIAALHAGEPLVGWGLRRLIGALARAAEAVAYAHSRGVVHRDLKPANLMLGRFGEVLVVDWGLAALGSTAGEAGGEPGDSLEGLRSGIDSLRTRVGTVAGTPAYMAPEQARGALDEIGPATDVYALGACLYELLAGHAPYRGEARWVLSQVIAGAPLPSPALADAPLAALIRTSMGADGQGRGSASGFARTLQDWLDGAQRRDQALSLVQAAHQAEPRAEHLEAESRRLADEAEVLRSGVPDWAPVHDKHALWELEDRAAAAQTEARALRRQAERDLYGALGWDASAPQVRAALAELHRQHHLHAEARGDAPAAEAALGLLRAHAEALPALHADRQRHVAYLDGHGSLSLVCEPPARAELYRFELEARQLRPVFVEDLGDTPVHRHRLPMGSYLVRLSADGCDPVDYPVWISRQRHWDGVPPDAEEPVAVCLPRELELGPDDCLVPAGWFRVGARDSLANAPFPPAEVWLDALVVRRYPVRLSEYLDFLNDLARRGRLEEAMQRAPRPPKVSGPSDGVGFDGERFVLQRDRDGDLWQPDWPAIRIDVHDARAFADWEAERTGQPWRLPTEVEWEKAARGVDGRLYPWGDHGDFAFSNLRRSHREGLRLLPVDHPMLDVGPYGLVGMAGNVVCWTDSVYDEGVAPDMRGRLPTSGQGANTRISTRGGAFTWSLRAARAPDRKSLPATARSETTGIRLVRDAR